MIGNAADAREALTDHQADICDNLFSREGSTRTVYLINDVLYKVEDIAGINAEEYDVILNTRDILPDNIRFPQTSLFDIDGNAVIACERISGQVKYACACEYSGDICDIVCFTAVEYDIVCDFLNDPSGMNVIISDNVYYIIDAA